MKPYINLFTLICLGIAVIFLSGMESCNTEEEPAVFVSATPPDGSTIQEDATIVAIFDAPPSGVDVNVPDGVTFSSSGTTVTITGGFTPGPLTLVLTWAGGATTLTYTIGSDPDSPSPEEQLAGKYDLIQFDYDDDIFVHGDWWFGLKPPLTPPTATGTLLLFEGGAFSLEWEVVNGRKGAGGSFSSDKWEASTTKIFLEKKRAIPESLFYTWQGTTRTTLILGITLPPDWGAYDPQEQILVWKRTE